MKQIKSITFFNPNKIVGGGEYLFIRVVKFLASNTKIKIYYIDYIDGFARTLLKDENIEFIDYNPNEKMDIDIETCIVAHLVYLFNLINDFNLSEKVRVLLWSIHHYDFLRSLPFFEHYIIRLNLNLKNVKNLIELLYKDKLCLIRKVFNFLHKNNSLVFMDFPNFNTHNYCLSLNLDEKKYLPIPMFSVDHEIKSESIDNNIINIAWLGRLINFKINPLLTVIQHANAYSRIYDKKIRIHIIGTGAQEKRIRNCKLSKNVELIFLGTVIEDELNQYLLNNIDILFAMGTSCLEGAKLHIPSILLDSCYNKMSSSYKYKWLFESFEYALGEDANELTIENKHTFDDVINSVYIENNKKLIAEKCYNYFKENHSVDIVSEKLLNYLEYNTFSYQEFLNTDIGKLNEEVMEFRSSNKNVKRIKFCINVIKYFIMSKLKNYRKE